MHLSDYNRLAHIREDGGRVNEYTIWSIGTQ